MELNEIKTPLLEVNLNAYLIHCHQMSFGDNGEIRLMIKAESKYGVEWVCVLETHISNLLGVRVVNQDI